MLDLLCSSSETYYMRRAVAAATGGFCVLATVLVSGLNLSAIAGVTSTLEPPYWLTNLVQLRRCAEQEPSVVHPFRIVAEVYDVDTASDVLVLRDPSGVEFIKIELQGRDIEPGATVCLEAKGCGVKPKDFGLAVVPGLVVDNDGLHEMRSASGRVFLRAGTNQITVQWFNGLGGFGLNVEYEGPGVRRQPIPSSVLSRAKIDPERGVTNFLPGLKYRRYEGTWTRLPDFARYHPVETGVATNFGLNDLKLTGAVGLEFHGYITIPRDGLYTFYVDSDDGSRLFVGESSLDLRVLTQGPAPQATDKVPLTAPERNSRPWVTLEGTMEFWGVRGTAGEMVMRVANDNIRVRIFESGNFPPGLAPGSRVRVTGIYQDVVTGDGSRVPGMLLVSSWKAVLPVPPSERSPATATSNKEATNQSVVQPASAATTIPAITTAAEVKALSADMANQELPVSVRGVVTAILADYLRGAVIQDYTKGVFISLQYIPDPKLLQIGEFYQVDGVTGSGAFAPVVVARNITHLGAGFLPQPIRATWDQLRNGSLDTQYIEIEGVVTASYDQQIRMLTAGGMITLVLDDLQPEDLRGYKNALVQIRGCAFACFNPQTRELDTSSLRILGGAISVLQPAPHDLFDATQKNIGELLLYDPKAAPFRLLKVSGQIIYARPGEYFLTDGTNGMRVAIRNSDRFSIGDLVDAVGFLDLGDPVAGFKEAVMRKTGRAPLPAPTRLTPEHLLLAKYSGTLVQVEAVLMNHWRDGDEHVLELQSGLLVFRARLNTQGGSVPLPPVGSRLDLAGVYAPKGGRTEDGKVSGFELLLHSPAGIHVVSTPPWWTLKRVLVLAGVLGVLLLAVLLWNRQLQLQVQERSRKLEIEIRNRQQAELLHAAEAERSRIARDLHDELGASLTEVSLLASTGLSEFSTEEKKNDCLRIIANKARALVSALDVIVWAVDPKHDSLQSFTDYIGGYANELLSSTKIVCRLKFPIECDAVTLPGPVRHSLFLALKEALNNVIRHASATEVKLQMAQVNNSLEIVVADNGCGFDFKTVHLGNGLTNIRERLEALNGQCNIESRPGNGTTVKLVVPLSHDASD